MIVTKLREATGNYKITSVTLFDGFAYIGSVGDGEAFYLCNKEVKRVSKKFLSTPVCLEGDVFVLPDCCGDPKGSSRLFCLSEETHSDPFPSDRIPESVGEGVYRMRILALEGSVSAAETVWDKVSGSV